MSLAAEYMEFVWGVLYSDSPLAFLLISPFLMFLVYPVRMLVSCVSRKEFSWRAMFAYPWKASSRLWLFSALLIPVSYVLLYDPKMGFHISVPYYGTYPFAVAYLFAEYRAMRLRAKLRMEALYAWREKGEDTRNA
ncbi:MAG: hypothetical protein AAF662_01540 [Pseudomonadota bacterium]